MRHIVSTIGIRLICYILGLISKNSEKVVPIGEL